MVRILVWSERTWPTPGGAELLAILLPVALQACGHEIEIIASRLPDTPDDEIVSGLRVHRVSIPPSPTADQLGTVAAGLARTRQLIGAFQPELMLLIQPHALLMYYAGTRRFAPIPSIFSLQMNLEAEWGADQLVGRMIRESDYVVSCSTVLMDAVRWRIPEVIPKSETIQNALPLTAVLPEPLPWDEPRFLCIGRLAPEKNFATALRAFARVAANHPSARLVVSGDGPEMGALRSLAAALDVEQRVDFTGWVPQAEVYAAMNRATVIVAPSLAEGLPLVGIQALQTGRPVLGARSDGLIEVVVDGETGYLFEPNDDATLAALMSRMLENRQRTVTMGQSARSRAETVFNWDEYVRRYDQLIRRLSRDESVSGSIAG